MMIRAGLLAVGMSAACLVMQAVPVAAQDYISASGAVLRGLDKVSGDTQDMDIPAGGSAVFGDLRVGLTECRYPSDNPAGEAFGYVSIDKISAPEVLFNGWMMASAPALNALDHPRYDVWVLRCKTPAAE